MWIINEGGNGKYIGLPEHFGTKKRYLRTSSGSNEASCPYWDLQKPLRRQKDGILKGGTSRYADLLNVLLQVTNVTLQATSVGSHEVLVENVLGFMGKSHLAKELGRACLGEITQFNDAMLAKIA